MVIELNDQIDELKHEVEQSRLSKKHLEDGELIFKKEIQGLKYDKKRQNIDLKDANERQEKLKAELLAYKKTVPSLKQQMSKEYEQRVLYENKLQQTLKQLNIKRAEYQNVEYENEKLRKMVIEMEEEARYLEEMKLIKESEMDGENQEGGDYEKADKAR